MSLNHRPHIKIHNPIDLDGQPLRLNPTQPAPQLGTFKFATRDVYVDPSAAPIVSGGISRGSGIGKKVLHSILGYVISFL